MSIALNGDGIISGVSSISNPSDITVGTGASVFSPAANTLALGTNGSERVRVDSSGNVGVGSDIPEAKLDIRGGEFYYHSGTSNNLGIKLTYSNGNSTGIIDTYGNHALEIRTNNAERLRVLAAGGLTFNGDTAAANALDDYEEGTFSPVYSVSGVSVSYSTQQGDYTKIGNRVFVNIRLFGTINTAGSGTVTISGLPFTVSGNTTASIWFEPLVLGTGYQLSAYIPTSNTVIRPYKISVNSLSQQDANINASEVGTNLELRISASYITTS